METISIESSKWRPLQEIENVLVKHWRVERAGADTLVVHGTRGRAYLYADSEKARSFRLLLDYSDIELAKQLLEVIADDPDIVVDNDFGTVLPGNQFVARIRSERGWDWRR